MFKKLFSAAALGVTLGCASTLALATTVQLQTVMGDIEINLYDETTPKTVKNFLSYVEEGAYTQTFIHRSVPGFIIQGGGFVYDEEEEEPVNIETRSAVANEPVWSNRKGTIAMAKLGNNPNSATSQWFINLGDNHQNLDMQNGGFTVFGEVTSGMDVVEKIAKLPRFGFGGAFGELPLRNFGEDELEDEVVPDLDHLVMISRIQVLDPSSDTAANLEPIPNTLIDEVDDSSSSSSGSMGWLTVMLLLGLGAIRRRRAQGLD